MYVLLWRQKCRKRNYYAGHNPKFDIDEECFRVAMPMFILLSKRLMLD